MMTFSGLRRDIKTHIPFTGNKISVRADLMNTFWTKISAQVNEASFTRNSDKKSFALRKIRTRHRWHIDIADRVSKWKVVYLI